jgi:hypothetical protein
MQGDHNIKVGVAPQGRVLGDRTSAEGLNNLKRLTQLRNDVVTSPICGASVITLEINVFKERFKRDGYGVGHRELLELGCHQNVT